jgi:hypothetical protein
MHSFHFRPSPTIPQKMCRGARAKLCQVPCYSYLKEEQSATIPPKNVSRRVRAKQWYERHLCQVASLSILIQRRRSLLHWNNFSTLMGCGFQHRSRPKRKINGIVGRRSQVARSATVGSNKTVHFGWLWIRRNQDTTWKVLEFSLYHFLWWQPQSESRHAWGGNPKLWLIDKIGNDMHPLLDCWRCAPLSQGAQWD